MSLSGCGEEVMTDAIFNKLDICLLKFEGEGGKKSANAGRLLKSSGSW